MVMSAIPPTMVPPSLKLAHPPVADGYHPKSTTSPMVRPTPLTIVPPSLKLAHPTVADGYNPKSNLPTPGFVGNLTEGHESALRALATEVHARGLWERMGAAVIWPAEDEDAYLLRFLRARKFDVPKALAMLLAHLEWRERIGVDAMAARPQSEALGCDESILRYYLPALHVGEDKQGRPVLWSKHGAFEVDSLLLHTTTERLSLSHVWEQEQITRRLREQSLKHSARISQVSAIVDLGGWHTGLMSRASMSYITEQVSTDSDNYPERQGCAILINVPIVFSLCWAVIAPMLDPVTKAKVQIFSSERYWKPALLELMELDQIPEEYGGTNPARMRDINDGAPRPAVAGDAGP
jgi:hypothetical protein